MRLVSFRKYRSPLPGGPEGMTVQHPLADARGSAASRDRQEAVRRGARNRQGQARLLLLLIAAFALQAQNQPKKKAPDLPPAVKSVIDLARNAPPEIFADTVARLAENGSIPKIPKKQELLADAFAAAGRAREPMPVVGLPGLRPDTRAIFRSKASELGLDALSLENRVLKLVAASDPAKARELFSSVPHPALDAQSCEDPLVPDASAYYTMAAEVAQSTFNAQEKKDEKHIQLLQAALAGARTPGEAAAFVQALTSVSLKPPELELLLGAIAAKLEALSPDYLSFTMTADKLVKSLDQFIKRAQEEKIDTGVLANGLRRFLTQQMTAPRCARDFGDATAAVKWFNTTFGSAFPPITADEIKPSQRLDGIKTGSYFDSPEAKQLTQEFQKIRSSPGSRAQLEDFLRDWSIWTPAGSDIDSFHQKFTILRGLFVAVPAGDQRELVASEIIQYLVSAQVESQYPEEWLYQVESMAESAGADKAKLMQEFRSSGDAGLVLYATLHL